MTQEKQKNKEWWEAISNTLTIQQGPIEIPPRILSFHELLAFSKNGRGTYVWLENLIDNTIKGCEILEQTFHNNQTISIFSGGFYSLLKKNYGKKYQCWTAWPEGRHEKIRLLLRSN